MAFWALHISSSIDVWGKGYAFIGWNVFMVAYCTFIISGDLFNPKCSKARCKNKNKRNNITSNLDICTRKENMAYSREDILSVVAKKEVIPS